MWLTDSFLATFFERWRGQCTYMLIHIQLLCTVINMDGGGGGTAFQTSENSESLENFEFF